MKELYICIDNIDYKVHMISYGTQTVQFYDGICFWSKDIPNIEERDLSEINYELKIK